MNERKRLKLEAERLELDRRREVNQETSSRRKLYLLIGTVTVSLLGVVLANLSGRSQPTIIVEHRMLESSNRSSRSGSESTEPGSETGKGDYPDSLPKEQQGASSDKSSALSTPGIGDKPNVSLRTQQPTRLLDRERIIQLRSKNKPTLEERLLKALNKPTPMEDKLRQVQKALARPTKADNLAVNSPNH